MNMDSKVPEIRFNGFNGEWVYKKLQDLADKGFSNGVFNDPQKVGKGYRLINVKDMYTGDSININNLSLVDIDEKEFKNNKVEYGDIFFTRSSLVREGIAYSNVNLSVRNDITFDGHLIRMQPCKATTDPVFLAYLFKTSSARKQFILGGKTTTMTTIGQSDIAVVELAQPDKPEQTQIGSYFQKLDALLNQHQQKHDKLSSIKKAMLEKVFPKSGETIPEIRFKGFCGEWEKKPFGSCFVNVPNNTLSRADLNYKTGLAKNIHYGDVLIKFGEVLDATNELLPFITNNDVANKLKHAALRDGDIIIADAAEDNMVGKCTELFNINEQLILSGLHTIAVRPTLPFASKYLGYYLNSSSFHDQLLSLMQGTKVLSISKTAIQNTNVGFPKSVEEQAAIGNYFQKLDNLINRHQQQITKLNNIKQACLSKMFV
ncbi:restriction endonuclease subunit S [Enterobacter sp. BNK-18]|uniref:restriction endonuclease subunit S n=1 Tax=Enterobacter sp. BNK-18 TaxID=3376155 RepID=UPI0039BF153F